MLKSKTTKKFDKELAKVGFCSELAEAIFYIANKQPLPDKYKDHALKHNWQGFRDCHIKPDLVLIYKITDSTLELHRLNSHSNLFG